MVREIRIEGGIARIKEYDPNDPTRGVISNYEVEVDEDVLN